MPCRCNSDSVTIDMRLFRHLVPRRLLPDDIFEDTSSEEESASASGSDCVEEEEEERQGVAEAPASLHRSRVRQSVESVSKQRWL
jgi:hypothetical protein